MPKSTIAQYSEKFRQLPKNDEERKAYDKEFGAVSEAWSPEVRRIIRDKLKSMQTGSPMDLDDPARLRRSDVKFKIRQVWSLLDESSTQMIALNVMLKAIVEDSYRGIEKVLPISLKSLFSTISTVGGAWGGAAAGAAIGSAVTPGPGTVFGAVVGGMIGGKATKKFVYKNIEDVVTKKNPQWKIKNRYPSRTVMDEEISKAYTGHKVRVNGVEVTGGAMKSTVKEMSNAGSNITKFPFNDLFRLAYEDHKLFMGLTVEKTKKLTEFLSELREVLAEEMTVARACFDEYGEDKLSLSKRNYWEEIIKLKNHLSKELKPRGIKETEEDLAITPDNLEKEFDKTITLLDENRAILESMSVASTRLSEQEATLDSAVLQERLDTALTHKEKVLEIFEAWAGSESELRRLLELDEKNSQHFVGLLRHAEDETR